MQEQNNNFPIKSPRENCVFKSIRYSVLLHFALKNFVDKKLRSFLTVFGVVIGVSAVFFLLSFGLGVQSLVTQQVIGDKSLKAVDVNSPNSKIIKLNETAVNLIKTYPHVDQVGVQYSFPGIMNFNGGEIDVVAYGFDIAYQSLSSLTVINGRLLEAKDSDSILLNMSALRSVGIEDPKIAVNQTLKITVPLEKVEAKSTSVVKTFRIVGVVESGSGSEVFMPSNVFDLAGVPTYNNLKVVVDNTLNVSSVRAQIESMGLQTTSLADTMDEINNIFKFLNLVLIGFGSIGMIVAVLGMFNTLTISLIERTKEIGLMMALGARRRDMKKLFILDATIISFFGAVAGIILAIITGKIVNLYINMGASARGVTEPFDLFMVPLWAVLAITLATILIGLLVVYYPARRAGKINPIDALRRE